MKICFVSRFPPQFIPCQIPRIFHCATFAYRIWHAATLPRPLAFCVASLISLNYATRLPCFHLRGRGTITGYFFFVALPKIVCLVLFWEAKQTNPKPAGWKKEEEEAENLLTASRLTGWLGVVVVLTGSHQLWQQHAAQRQNFDCHLTEPNIYHCQKFVWLLCLLIEAVREGGTNTLTHTHTQWKSKTIDNDMYAWHGLSWPFVDIWDSTKLLKI